MPRIMRTIEVATALVLLAGPAQAISSLSLEWQGTGGSSTITVSSAVDAVIIVDVVMTADAALVSSFGISFRFDADLKNELDFIGGRELPFVGGTIALVPGTWTMGTVAFRTNRDQRRR